MFGMLQKVNRDNYVFVRYGAQIYIYNKFEQEN